MLRLPFSFSTFTRQFTCKIIDVRLMLVSTAPNLKRMSSSPTTVVTPAAAQGTELRVQHDAEQQKFVIQMGTEDKEAVLQYTETSQGAVDLWHTSVSPPFRGKGVAKLLAQAALDHFSSQKVYMRLSCTYLQRHAQLFPDPKHQKFILSD